MKKLFLYDKLQNEVILNFDNITQLLGSNGEKKDYIISTIVKYFSTHRYDSNEELQNYVLKVDDDEIGRGYFNTILFKNINDIDMQISSSKKTILFEYLTALANEFEITREICLLNEDIQRIVNKFNDEIKVESLNVEMDIIDYDFTELMKNNFNINIQDDKYDNLEYISNYTKLMCYLEILIKINSINPQRRLIIFHNIDNYIREDEYIKFVVKLNEICISHDIHFIISTSKENYVYLNEESIKGINIINDTVFNIEDIEMLKEFIENNYPYDRKFENHEIINILCSIIQKIGKKCDLINIDSQVALKILNNDELIETKGIRIPNTFEIKYIQCN